MLVETIIIAAVIALLKGVRIRDFGGLEFRVTFLLVVVAFLRIAIRLFPGYSPLLFPASILALATFAALNLRVRGMILVLSGITMNLAATFVSRGRMPVSRLAASSSWAGDTQLLTHVMVKGNLLQRILGDTIILGSPYPWPMAFSLGDVLLSIGVLIMVLSIGRHRTSAQTQDTTPGGREG